MEVFNVGVIIPMGKAILLLGNLKILAQAMIIHVEFQSMWNFIIIHVAAIWNFINMEFHHRFFIFMAGLCLAFRTGVLALMFLFVIKGLETFSQKYTLPWNPDMLMIEWK